MVEVGRTMISKLIPIALSIAVTGICYQHLVTRAYDSARGRRFPYLAYDHGKLLVMENGSPLRFSTKEQARQYECEHASEELPRGLAGDTPCRSPGLGAFLSPDNSRGVYEGWSYQAR